MQVQAHLDLAPALKELHALKLELLVAGVKELTRIGVLSGRLDLVPEEVPERVRPVLAGGGVPVLGVELRQPGLH
eukprot:11044906-Lingulodinium_polyedra.AAC.1